MGITQCNYPLEIAGKPIVLRNALPPENMSLSEIDSAVTRRANIKHNSAIILLNLAESPLINAERVGDNHRGTSIQDTAPGSGISGRLSITLSTKPNSSAVSAVIKLSRSRVFDLIQQLALCFM